MAAEAMQNGTAERSANGAGGGARVLVVDDDPLNLEVLAEVLFDRGFNVRTAANAAEALAEAHRRRPALVLADVAMPGMDGVELCAAIKRDPRLGNVPVVLLSADGGDPRERARGADAGAAEYLSKPVDLEGLLRVVRRLST